MVVATTRATSQHRNIATSQHRNIATSQLHKRMMSNARRRRRDAPEDDDALLYIDLQHLNTDNPKRKVKQCFATIRALHKIQVFLVGFFCLVVGFWLGGIVFWNKGADEQPLEPQQRVSRQKSSPDSSIFDYCRYPQQPHSGSPDCVYFRPNFVLNPQAYKPHSIAKTHKKEINRHLKDEIEIKWGVYGFQAANFGPQPLLGEEGNGRNPLLKNHIESVTILAAPKCGSRSLYEVFLSHVARKPAHLLGAANSKNPANTQKVGSISGEFVEALQDRQRNDGVLDRQEYAAAGIFNFFNPPPQRQQEQKLAPRRDIVFSVVRDPISRFVSSITQLISMLGTKRCIGCGKYLTPCLAKRQQGKDEGGPEQANQLLQCLATSMELNGFWNEHLVPWVHFITKPLHSQQTDVEVAVFDINGINDIMDEFGIDGGTGRRRLMEDDEKSQTHDDEGDDVGGNSDPKLERLLANAKHLRNDLRNAKENKQANSKAGGKDMGQKMRTHGNGQDKVIVKRQQRDVTHLNKFDDNKFMTAEGEALRGLVKTLQTLESKKQMSRDVIDQLCRLYGVDADIMKYLGFQVNYC